MPAARSRRRPPALYAALHTGTPGDLAFYLAVCRGARTVLELGCGHGRVLLALAREGIEVTGVDRDRGLLGLARDAAAALPPARARAVHLVAGDLRTIDLGARFDRVLIPYNTLYALDAPADQRTCLQRAAAHLAPGGQVVFDGYASDDFHAHGNEDEAQAAEDGPVALLDWEGTPYHVMESTRWHRDAQRLDVRYRYLPRGREDANAAVFHDRIVHRYLLTGELEPLCRQAGLRMLRCHGDFEGAPLTGDSGHWICVAAADDGTGPPPP